MVCEEQKTIYVLMTFGEQSSEYNLIFSLLYNVLDYYL